MSKSADNYVGISEPPFEMLQKLMLVDDAVIWRYYELLSSLDNASIADLRADVAANRCTIIDVKERFAMEIVTRFHSADDARAALLRRKSVAAGGLPEDIEQVTIGAEGDTLWIGKALALANLAKSSSEGARLVKGGAVHVDGVVVQDEKATLQKGQTYLVRVGSKNRRFARLTIQ
jgi:tyrosyl-tRNA synthetase